MGLLDRLADVDQELARLGAVNDQALASIVAEWSGLPLGDVDRALDELAAGVAISVREAPKAALAQEVPTVQDVPSPIEASALPETEAAESQAASSEPASSEAPEADSVPLPPSLAAVSMSEPPPSMMPPPPEDDADPFAGQPAPMPVPERARRSSLPPAAVHTALTAPPRSMPPVMPTSVPAPPKRTPRTIRTSVAPPPLPSSRPLSMRPTDTPDPFAPPNLASSRPPAPRGGLDADDLFGGASSAPPAGGQSLKPGALAAPKPPSPDKTDPPGTQAAANGEDDFELLVDDEMLEIDIEEELD